LKVNFMNKSKLVLNALVLAAALGTAGTTFAQDKFDLQMWQDTQKIFAMLDKNKNSMVDKAEFLEMMGKSFDMAMDKMGTKGGTKMTAKQFQEFFEMMHGRRGG
jgi:Ca2+-binding EF-hand superfamily protein